MGYHSKGTPEQLVRGTKDLKGQHTATSEALLRKSMLGSGSLMAAARSGRSVNLRDSAKHATFSLGYFSLTDHPLA